MCVGSKSRYFPEVRSHRRAWARGKSCFPLVSFFGSIPLGAWTVTSHVSVEEAFHPEIRLGGAVGQSVGVCPRVFVGQR